MRRLILILILIVPSFLARAVEDIAPEEVGQDPGISGDVSISYSTKGGNTEKDETDVGGKVTYDSNRKWLAFIQGTYEKTRSSEVITEDEIFAHARYLHRLTGDVLYGEAFLQYHGDVFQGIDEWWLTGGGLRWRYVNDPNVGKLYVGGGAFVEEVNYTDDFPEEDGQKTRFNSYLAYTCQLTEKAEFSLIGYYQPVYDDAGDYYTAINAELSLNIISELYLSLQYEFDRDSRPPEGIKKVDQESKVSLMWKF